MPTESDAELAARVTVEIRLRAVTAVGDGAAVVDVAEQFGVTRQTVTAWRRRYEAHGLDGLRDRSRKPHSSPHRIPAGVEALICELRREHRRWGARRIAFELRRVGQQNPPSRSTVHRVLVRNGLVNPQDQQHKRVYKRWAREVPMHLWQLDLVGGIHLVGGRECKILTGIDDHSRFVVLATVLEVPSGPAVVDAFVSAMGRWGVPVEVLTDNGKQFTGKFTRPMPVEVLFERTCREYGIAARLTKRRSPTTTGKIERFHRTLRRELLDEVGAFASIEDAQAALDEWVHAYNTERPHQSLDMQPPAAPFRPGPAGRPATPILSMSPRTPATTMGRQGNDDTTGAREIDLRVPAGGVVQLVGAQQIWVGKAFAGRVVTVWADLTTVHVLLDDGVLKTLPSRLASADLARLADRGARPGRTAPAAAALTRETPAHTAVEVDRTATRDGIVAIAGHEIALGPENRHRRVTLRIDQGLIHAIADGQLIRTLPSPLQRGHVARLRAPRQASTPLPPPPAAGAQRVQRRVPIDGVTMVAGQRLRIGRT
ncbi:IS481 family transposase, partial [Microbacterium aurantiacum]|uniref:IS481 family transposase n=1 Tax=Microbacterium aurantiacum TaxID=162393 RepID=UPI004036A3F3